MVKRRIYPWWYAIVAGLDERFGRGEGFGQQLSKDRLKAIIAFELTTPVYEKLNGTMHRTEHPWKDFLLESNPALVCDAYTAVARTQLSSGEQIAEGLREILSEPPFEPFRNNVAISFLREFPNASEFRLGELFDVVISARALHADFLVLATRVLSGAQPVDERQRDLWLVATYFLAPIDYEREVRNRTEERPSLVFDLRDRTGFARRGQPEQNLPIPMLEFMAQLTGTMFPSAEHPVDGWSGDTNPWDGSEHFRALLGLLSASASAAATESLSRLRLKSRI